MKTGRTLQDLAGVIQRRADSKRDFTAPTNKLTVKVLEGEARPQIVLDGLGNGASQLPINDWAHGQIAGETGIPAKYYNRLLEGGPANVQLLATNVNHWFQREPKRRLVRVLDGRVRAFLSDKFRCLDEIDLAEAALPTLSKMKCEVLSAEVTDKRLYIKAVHPTLRAEVKGSKRVGDIVRAGVSIATSEIGAGRLLIEEWFDFLACTNGMIRNSVFAKIHLGARQGEDDIREMLTSEAKSANDRAFWLTVRDVVAKAFNEEEFQKSVAQFSDTTRRQIEGNPEEVLGTVQELYGLSDGTRGNVLRHLIRGGDLSQWGLINAVTASADDEEDYDAATELERVGGKIVELSPRQWEQLAA